MESFWRREKYDPIFIKSYLDDIMMFVVGGGLGSDMPPGEQLEAFCNDNSGVTDNKASIRKMQRKGWLQGISHIDYARVGDVEGEKEDTVKKWHFYLQKQR